MSANSSGVKLTRNNIDEVLFFRSDDGLLCVCGWCSKKLIRLLGTSIKDRVFGYDDSSTTTVVLYLLL